MRRSTPLIALLVGLALVGAACSSKGGSSTQDQAAIQAKIDQAAAKSPGALLRSTLDTALGEHVALLAEAGAAAAQGQTAGVAAASSRLLGKNASDVATAVGQIYPDAVNPFVTLWRKHITFFLNYASAAAKNNAAGKRAAADQLNAYAAAFAAFLNGLNASLDKDAVASLFKEHVTTVLAAFDADVAKDYAKADSSMVAAYSHMDAIGKAFAVAVRKEHPEKLAGIPDSKPADLRASFDTALQEHSVLLYNLGSAIVSKNTAAARAAVDALNANAGDVAAIFGAQFGGSAQSDILSAWEKQIPLYESYARAVVAENATAAGTARDDLATQADTIGKAVLKLSPNAGGTDVSVGDFVKLQMLSIKEVFDQLGRGQFGNADDALVRAIGHMQDLSAELADAIAKQFPTKFV